MLIAPLIAFLLMMFVVPLAFILVNSVHIPGIPNGLPNFYRALMADEAPVPGESVFRSLAQDILAARKAGGLPRILKPLRHQDRLVWRLFTRTSRKLPSQFNRPVKEWFVSHDKKWAEPETWTITRRVARRFTPYYFINSVDLEHKASGEFRIKKKGARVYLGVLSNTFEISFFVTVFTFMLGYPLAYWLATMSERKANLFMICILLPFWTSFLVRTYVWILILQTEGPLNSILLWTGFIDEPLSLIEFALVADGVPFEQVYDILGTDEGIDRAFAKLDELKPYVKVWWTSGAQPAQLLSDGEVAYSTAYSNRLLHANRNLGQDLRIRWNGQLYDVEYLVVVKGTSNKETAMQLLAFASTPEAQADLANTMGVGPAVKGASQMLIPEVRPNIPSTHLDEGFSYDINFWAENGEVLNERFNAWLGQ